MKSKIIEDKKFEILDFIKNNITIDLESILRRHTFINEYDFITLEMALKESGATFLDWTISKLVSCGKSLKDIHWIGLGEIKVSWEDFKKISNFSYARNDLVDLRLKILGKDWVMLRHQYDSSHDWRYFCLQEPLYVSNGFKITVDKFGSDGGESYEDDDPNYDWKLYSDGTWSVSD